MFMGKYIIAGVAVEIVSIYENVHHMCAAYRCADETQVQLSVHITQLDIAAEQEKSNEEAAWEGLPIVTHSAAYLETLAVYRKLAKQMMMEHAVLLFHRSAVAVDGQAVLFTAKSGTGKSTHTRLWREMLGERCVMVNDYKPLLQIWEEGTQVCGTPWNGKHNLGTNCTVPLRAICILERGEHNTIEKLLPKDALPMLIQQSYRAENATAMLQQLKLIDKMAKNVCFYRLRCNMDPEAARVSYEAMLGE
jgi:hypothetical protein